MVTLPRVTVRKWAGMATILWRDKWRTALWVLLAGLAFAPRRASGCHPASRKLHICLNIYLERDLFHIETIVEGRIRVVQQGQGHVMFEGPGLLNICNHVETMRDCYEPLVLECRELWQLDRFPRLRDVLRATYDHLCANGTDNLRDILYNSGCLGWTKTNLASCTGFDWFMSWREILRMQVSPEDRCAALKKYRDCLQQRLATVVCGSEASRAYLPLFDVWLEVWCRAGSTPEEDHKNLYYSLETLKEIVELTESIKKNETEQRNATEV